MDHIKAAFKTDSNNVTLKAMPGITRTHLYPNDFEKMRVSYAFQLLLQELHLYKVDLEKKCGSIAATQVFFK